LPRRHEAKPAGDALADREQITGPRRLPSGSWTPPCSQCHVEQSRGGKFRVWRLTVAVHCRPRGVGRGMAVPAAAIFLVGEVLSNPVDLRSLVETGAEILRYRYEGRQREPQT